MVSTDVPLDLEKGKTTMIALTRRQARCLRGIFRRSVLGISHRGIIPPLVFRAEETQLRVQYRYAPVLAVEQVEPAMSDANETIALPLDALADFEGRAESPVVLEAAAPDRTIVRWEDRGIPQSREYTIPAVATTEALPSLPASWAELPAALLDALAEAGKTTADDTARYALNCIQLRGDCHEVVATDGRQLLVSGGFTFPWRGDVLVRHVSVLASRELPRDQPVSVGKTDTHVIVRTGCWTLFLEIQKDVRFPRVDQVIPDAQAMATRLSLDATDATFLSQALERLPGLDEQFSPVTLDCNGRIAVRTKGVDQTQPTEVVLNRSRYTGAPVRFNCNRAYLARAVRLGFGEIEIVDAKSPIVCRDRNRIFGWQPLSEESALEATDDVIRIESTSATTASITENQPPTPMRTIVTQHTRPTKGTSPDADHVSSNGSTNGHVTPESPVPATLAALVEEATALHESLSDTRARAGRLIVALRRYRKRERLMSSALESLKQLKLQEVAE
jgi:hypothetical protein